MRSLGGKNISFKPFQLFYSYFFSNRFESFLLEGGGGPDPPDPPPGTATAFQKSEKIPKDFSDLFTGLMAAFLK